MRVVVGLDAGHLPATVTDALLAHGARAVRGPAPSLPDVLVAEFPDDDDATVTLERVAALSGVRYAERDTLRSTLD